MGNDFSYLCLPSVLRLKHGEVLLGLWRRADGDGQVAAQEVLADLQLEQAHKQHQEGITPIEMHPSFEMKMMSSDKEVRNRFDLF